MEKRLLFLLSLTCILLAVSCKKVGEDLETLQKVEVNPDFENAPPIAEEISFEVLKEETENGSNIRFMAKFKQSSLDDQFLALLIGDQKMVLRDDGKGADQEAGDLIFSIFIKENIEELQSGLSERFKEATTREEAITFTNRKLKKLPVQKITNQDLLEIVPGKVIQFPIDFFIPLGLGNQKKSLMVTNTNVVEDTTRTFNPCTGMGNPSGVWTFGELMRQLASSNGTSIATDAQVSDFVLNWLNTWMNDATVNGELLPARTQIQNQIITPWLNRSAANGAPSGQLKMEFAPFKLTAIVNRLDLRGNSGYGFSNAGEGRFVFCALSNSCTPLEFNVIFEYGINKKSCSSVKAFAQEWADLNGMTLGTPAYNQALENIILQFTQAGTNPSKPNESSLNQIRTNEVALSSQWQLREFNLTDTGNLELVTVKMEPAVKFNAKVGNSDVERLVKFINDNESDIKTNSYEVPLTSTSPPPSTPFLGGKSQTEFPPVGTPTGSPTNNPHHWNGTPSGTTFILNDTARHVFSLNTCSGCHGGETQTFFTHIDPSPFGSEAGLSGFLTGTPGRGGAIDFDGDPGNDIMTVSDAANRPATSPALWEFNDLKRREIDLENLLTGICISRPFFELAHKLTFEPIRMVH